MNAYNAQRLSAGTVALGIAQRASKEARNFCPGPHSVWATNRQFSGLVIDAGRHVDQPKSVTRIAA